MVSPGWEKWLKKGLCFQKKLNLATWLTRLRHGLKVNHSSVRRGFGHGFTVFAIFLCAKKSFLTYKGNIRKPCNRVSGDSLVITTNKMDKPNSKRWAWVTPRSRERKTAPEGSTYGNDSRYSRKPWLTLRAQVLQAEPLCRECSKRGRVEAAAMVDHIEPVTAGGAFYDWENLQPLCNSCHAKKSACEGNAKKRKNAL
jgi:5-methylcytosine-specific restriction protein A